jgi:hypothetical protein
MTYHGEGNVCKARQSCYAASPIKLYVADGLSAK